MSLAYGATAKKQTRANAVVIKPESRNDGFAAKSVKQEVHSNMIVEAKARIDPNFV